MRRASSSVIDPRIMESITIRTLPYLPVSSLPMSSHRITLRTLRHDEISLFYEAARDAADDSTSTGSYGVDELPDITYFAFGFVFFSTSSMSYVICTFDMPSFPCK